METQFLKKTAAIVLMTVLVYRLTGAVPVGDGCPVPPPVEYNELQAHCNVTTNASQANATLYNLYYKEYFSVRPSVAGVCVAANACELGNPPPPKSSCPSPNKDFLHQRLSVQVVRLQQLNNSLCAVVHENSSNSSTENSTVFDPCKRLQKPLQGYILGIDNYLKMVKCGCTDNLACYYQPGMEVKGGVKSPALNDILIEILYTIDYIGVTIGYEYYPYQYICGCTL